MAIGKNKKLNKMGKKGNKKRADPFDRKEWYDIKVPSMFNKRTIGKTLVNRSQGMSSSTESLMGRVYEANLADLQGDDEDQAFRRIKLKCEDISGKHVLTNFYGMDFVRDRYCALVRKWQTLIEASVDVRTADGYVLRMFCIAFTEKRKNQVSKACYAKSSQIRAIRAKMIEIMKQQAEEVDLKGLVTKFIPGAIGKDIKKSCQGIFPLQNVYVRKVKTLKAPKFDSTKFMEMYADGGHLVDPGVPVEREETDEEEVSEEEDKADEDEE